MITVVGGIKGGGGKTTIATNLCVMRSQSGKKVLLVDADEQRTASDWVAQREALEIYTPWVTIQLAGISLSSQIQKIRPSFDDIIIDVGGRDTTSQRSALLVADICIIPFRPKSFDMWTLGAVKTMINEIKTLNKNLISYVVLNQAEARGPDNLEALEMIREFTGFICIEPTLGQRKSFANAATNGLGIVELKKQDPKASEEMSVLYNIIYETHRDHT
jgi:chromosome partitioning protein